MSALAHYFQEEGLATTAIALVRQHAEKIRPPRALWVPLHLGRPLGAPDEPEFQKRVLRAALALLESADGPAVLEHFPGTADKIVFRETASPVTHTRFTRATDGTGYGLAATPEQFMKGRPGYRGPVPGLYLAGANTRSGHGIVGAMASGKECAVRILRDAGVS